MSATITPLSYDPADYRWVVRFAFWYKNQAQADAVQALGGLAFDVVRLWLDVLVADAQVFQPPGESVETIGFPTRASARRFVRTWGGRLHPMTRRTPATSAPGLTQIVGRRRQMPPQPSHLGSVVILVVPARGP